HRELHSVPSRHHGLASKARQPRSVQFRARLNGVGAIPSPVHRLSTASTFSSQSTSSDGRKARQQGGKAFAPLERLDI
ncbi:hypothetical protein DFH09DRAFT_1374372, partial [Mycena vulgaris]